MSEAVLDDGTRVRLVPVSTLKPDQPRWYAHDRYGESPSPMLQYGGRAGLHCRNAPASSTERAWVEVDSEPVAKPLLTTDKAARKAMPIARGVVDYFPRALAAVAHVSFKANEQHNPGEPMHWDKSKSTDHEDCIMRHLIERGATDDDGLLHSAKLAWRALALLETELEAAATKVTP